MKAASLSFTVELATPGLKLGFAGPAVLAALEVVPAQR
jgi:hypothetical protein